MSSRPTIRPDAVAEIIGRAPARVRKRLDREPAIADQWDWTVTDGAWLISVGDETVTLGVDKNGQVTKPSDATCTCLLSPNCFHVLACVTTLKYSDDVGGTDEAVAETETVQQRVIETDQPQIAVTDSMKVASRLMLDAIENVLLTGARASGLLIQSSLLRAAHQCRAEGLVHLSNSAIRVAEGIQRIRGDDDHADSEVLRTDIVAVIQYARSVMRNEQLTPSQVGYLRRPYAASKLARLSGIVAEPILTLSGYAGVCIHLIGDDERLYQVVELRPGEASLVSNAYRGGIDLGATTMSAQELCRCSVDVQNLTVSPDGRLGKGTKTRWAVRNRDETVAAQSRLELPIATQIDNVFASIPSIGSETRAGWDLVCFVGTVLGAHGSTVLFQVDGFDQALRLGIAIDSDHLAFRRNLQMLARCRGLSLRVIGRVRLDAAGRIDALSIQPSHPAESSNDDSPVLTLPNEFQGVCNLGFDELQRNYFSRAERFATEVAVPADVLASDASSDDSRTDERLFPGLDRRLTAWVTGGRTAIAPIGSSTHRRDHRRLMRRTQSSAAKILDAIAISASASLAGSHGFTQPHRNAMMLAAANHYCDVARENHQHDRWRSILAQSTVDQSTVDQSTVG